MSSDQILELIQDVPSLIEKPVQVKLGVLLELLTDYHANGAYEKLKANVELLDSKDYSVMIRTTNFEQNDFINFKYITEDAYNFLAKSKVFPHDLIMNKIANAGSVYLMPDLKRPVSLAMNLFLIRIKKDLANPIFVYLFLKLNESYVKQFANGSVTKTITKEAVRNLDITLPAHHEQDEIVDFFKLLTDRISLLRETNTTLEAIAQALFKSWFVDFDPVHAKQQGRIPEGMIDATASLFPDSFEESELGMVPKGWTQSTLAQAYEINPSRQLKKGSVAPYVEMASVPTIGHSVDGVIDREMGSGTKFKNGDTLLARITPCLENGKTAFVDFLKEDQIAWGSTEFVVLRPKTPLPEYHAYLLCRETPFRTFAIQSMSGTSGRQRIQNDVLGAYPIVIPTEQIANAFSEVVTPIQKKIAANHATAQTIATLRDTLLPRLISGSLRLPETESVIKENSDVF